MKTLPTLIGLLSLAASTCVAVAAPTAIKLPAERSVLRPSPLPGHEVATQKCGICHSADYIDYQPPGMTVKQWTAEMTKMQKAYGAPISDDEIKLLGVYFASAYGDAKSVTEADAAMKPVVVAATAAPVPSGKAPDVKALLAANGCLACHAIDKMVFGPSYHDVALKYKSDPQAAAHLATSIQQGGSGKWGSMPMPAFANLGTADANALAEFVLKQ